MARKIIVGDRGVLKAARTHTVVSLNRYAPETDLRRLVDWFWVVEWNLERDFSQDVLPFPSVNLSIEGTGGWINGVIRGKSTRVLRGTDFVVAAMFRPGGFFPFYNDSISGLTDRVVPIENVFGVEEGETERVNALEAFLTERLPSIPPDTLQIQEIVNTIKDNPDITTVELLSAEHNVSVRTLQRLFKRYVGVSPKWVIRLYRLQDAAMRIDGGSEMNWSALAFDLEYADQAHFIRDFKSMLDTTPKRYEEGD